jgi:hypothetical protein
MTTLSFLPNAAEIAAAAQHPRPTSGAPQDRGNGHENPIPQSA